MSWENYLQVMKYISMNEALEFTLNPKVANDRIRIFHLGYKEISPENIWLQHQKWGTSWQQMCLHVVKIRTKNSCILSYLAEAYLNIFFDRNRVISTMSTDTSAAFLATTKLAWTSTATKSRNMKNSRG